ncbi:conserved hypothetical protein [gamma proteobacterium HdN1]|nr:conserved hypothetical protein [gamma proteobacterium HdN1]
MKPLLNRPLGERYSALLAQIRSAAQRYQWPAPLLLAASKTRSASEIRELFEAGCRDFGESYLQEALPKMEALQDLPITWHFIGPLQSNKTRGIASHFDWVHSVDSLRLAERLSEQRPPTLAPLNVCLQINLDNEPTKSGVAPEFAPPLANAIAALPHLRLRGLMCVPAPRELFSEQRQSAAALRALLSHIQAHCPRCHPALDTLSIGMSDDLEAAIAEGSTLVRVGSALFGPRPPKTP